MTDLMDQRLTEAARRWQAEQPAAPAIRLERLEEPLPRRRRHLRPLAAAAAAVLVVAGGASLVAGLRDSPSSTPSPSDPGGSRTVSVRGHAVGAVPWKDLAPGHPRVRHHVGGEVVTKYDRVSASGRISGRARPGDVIVFTAVLESPTTLRLDPCPDYSIAFGRKAFWTYSLNCAAVPFHDAQDRPVLPAFTEVRFAMRVRVPDAQGEQKVLWTLDGPQQMPGFYGLVTVTAG